MNDYGVCLNCGEPLTEDPECFELTEHYRCSECGYNNIIEL